ncbi:hypothetical protein K1T71_004325 [Dendrolimus kikuchii]|uniref:Uncharacterized protein n=1 Tax=Dendrolimus kikuchii TaxID=765133 RepID=A0ACC1D6Z8_9NEOP|nr:hypothetical protein K1T71_004325 [Dendrolimus kikuchii]
MSPIVTFLFLLSFSLPAVLSASPGNDGKQDDENTTEIKVTSCFEKPEVINSLQKVNRCYLDIVQELLNKTSTGRRTCSDFSDFEKEYDDLMKIFKNKCSWLHFGQSDSNYNTSIIDVLRVTLDREKFSEFVKDDGFNCLHTVSEPIRKCRKKTINLYPENHPYDDNTTFSFWKRTSIFTIDSFNCYQQGQFINCTMPELNANCGQESIRFINSTLKIFNLKCELAWNDTLSRTQSISSDATEGASTTSYWIVGAIAIVAIAVITIIYNKKRKAVKRDTSLEMK